MQNVMKHKNIYLGTFSHYFELYFSKLGLAFPLMKREEFFLENISRLKLPFKHLFHLLNSHSKFLLISCLIVNV